MLNNQNLILVAISIVSLTSIYLLYTNYQKMQDVAMIREEIVLLKSSLSKMNNYENEIFIKINDRLKQLEESLVHGKVPVRTKSSVEEISNNNELTEENVELLNQNYHDEPNIIEVSTEGLEPLNLNIDEIQELDDLQNNLNQDTDIITNEMRDISDTDHNNIVITDGNDLDVNNSSEIEDINLEELDNTDINNIDLINEEQVVEQLQQINQSVNSLDVTDLDNKSEEIPNSNNDLDITNNENVELEVNLDINLEELITDKEPSELTEEPEVIQVSETNEKKSPLDSFLIESGENNLDNDFADDLDLDDLDDLNEEENPISDPKELSDNYLNRLTVKELKVISKQKGLKTRGNKKELINIILNNK